MNTQETGILLVPVAFAILPKVIDSPVDVGGDLHSLFDAGLLRVRPGSLTIELNDALADTAYWPLNGARLRDRVDGSQVGEEYLKERLSTEIS
jgi:hypothetical protein